MDPIIQKYIKQQAKLSLVSTLIIGSTVCVKMMRL